MGTHCPDAPRRRKVSKLNTAYLLFAASSWPFAVMLAVPVFVVLFGLAFAFARTMRQRLANLLLGLLGSIVVMGFSLWYLFEVSQIPSLRQDDYVPVVAPTAMAIGAAIGVALSVLIRKGLARLIYRAALRTSSRSENENEDTSR